MALGAKTGSGASDQDSLAARLREGREYVGLSQEDVATALSLQCQTVFEIEAGARRVSLTELKRLANLYGQTVDELLGKAIMECTDKDVPNFLARAAHGLDDHDRAEVARFAKFLKNHNYRHQD